MYADFLRVLQDGTTGHGARERSSTGTIRGQNMVIESLLERNDAAIGDESSRQLGSNG